MFSLESNASGSYRPVYHALTEASAVSLFSDMLDQRRTGESVRVLKDGAVMARKTPKAHYFDPTWGARADRALSRI